ncbi:MAG: hypothetical protein J7L59_00460, partial [Nanoarchaeota archaeon]|nr:hypothetical protein [Nanoarchaeota archaeon]
VLTGVAFILGGTTASLPLVLLSIFLAGGFGLGRRPLLTSYMNKYIPSSERATVLSTVSMVRRFVNALANLVVGMMVDWSLSYTLITLGGTAILFSFISKVEEEHLID